MGLGRYCFVCFRRHSRFSNVTDVTIKLYPEVTADVLKVELQTAEGARQFWKSMEKHPTLDPLCVLYWMQVRERLGLIW